MSERIIMSNFLPNNYEIPNKSGNYMKFLDGDNRFRILAKPIMGWVGWVDNEEGNRRPVRKTMDQSFAPNEVEDIDGIKHFWAMPVWNYQEEKIQILEITQKGIQKAIKAISSDEDWGSPTNYDLVVKKTGQKLDTEYQVNPKPARKLDEAIEQAFEDMRIELDALFHGEDPFNSSSKIADDADKALN